MLKKAQALYRMSKDLQKEVITLLVNLEQETMQSNGIDATDTAYVCREVVEILKDLTTRINKVDKMAKLIANHFMVSRSLSKIVTDYCSAKAKPRLWYKIPYKRDANPEESDRLFMFLGVPPNIAELDVLRIHAPNFMDYLTKLIGDGEEVPVDPSQISAVEYGLSIRRKKDIA